MIATTASAAAAGSTSPRRGVRLKLARPKTHLTAARPFPTNLTAAGRCVGRGLVVGLVEDPSRAFGGPGDPKVQVDRLESQRESDGISGLPAPASRSLLGPAGPLSGHSVPIAVRPAAREGNPRFGDYSPTRRLSAVSLVGDPVIRVHHAPVQWPRLRVPRIYPLGCHR